MTMREHDSVLSLSDAIFERCEHHDNATVVAALSACLYLFLDMIWQGAGVPEPPATMKFREDLQQVASEAMMFRQSPAGTQES